VIAFPEAVQQLLDFRIREATTRYLGGFLAQERLSDAVAVVKLLWLLEVAVAGFAFLIVVATAGLAANTIVGDPDTAHLIVLYATGLFLASFDSASGSVLRVLDRFPLAFGASAVLSASRIGAIVTVVALGGDLEAIVLARVGAEAVGTIVQGGLAARALAPVLWSHRHAPIRQLHGQLREIARFLVNTNLTGVVRAASTKLDTVLVGLLAAPAAVSVYKVSIQVGTAPLLLGDALFSAVFPSFSRSYARGRRAEMRRVAYRTSALIAVVVVPATLIFAVAAPTIMGAVFGDYYRAAGLPTTLCLVGVSAYVSVFWAQPAILTTGHAGAFLVIMSGATVAQFGALVLLVPIVGAPGATGALGLMFLSAAIMQLAFIRSRRLLDRESSRAPPEAGEVVVPETSRAPPTT
jgi:O-antigen/teichoic acid export membrane protein